VADADSAPVPDRVEAGDLVGAEVEVWTPAEGQIKSKMDQVEIVDRVAVRVSDPGERQSRANQAEVRGRVAIQALDGAEVRDRAAVLAWVSAGRVAGSVPTDVLMLTRPRRPSRNRKFHQKKRRV